MSFRRADQEESYNITADWLKDFADNLKKKGNFLDNVAGIIEPRKQKFGSIEEKMVDIRQRVGFDSLATVRESEEVKTASACCEKCEGETSCKVASAQDSNIKAEQMKAILGFIKSMIQNSTDPNLSSVSVIEACRSHPQLNYSGLKINEMALKKAVDAALLEKNKPEVSSPEYVHPSGDMGREHSHETAEYFNHAFPQS